ncbi:MAG: hypothetical protein Udaeo_03200 [Candidatus Udaeobacter sp.]|nr:MAG: hypothetical protein Udaeo_03200 [Candidatus Udaeobacter sp.]
MLGQFGNPEIQHLHVAVRSQHDVLRFDIAVDDAGCVRGSQRRGHLHRNFQRRMRFYSTARDRRTQGRAFNKFHRDELPVGLRADLINRENVRMI